MSEAVGSYHSLVTFCLAPDCFERRFFVNGYICPPRALLAAALLSLGLPLATPASFARSSEAYQTVPASCDNRDFMAKQQAFENGGPKADVPVHICGTVIALSPKARRTRSGWHGYFYVAVAPNISIRIVSGLDEMNAPAWPWVNKGIR